MTRKELWAALDALELYETWLIAEAPSDHRATHNLAYQYNRRAHVREREMKMHTVADGYLFIRTK